MEGKLPEICWYVFWIRVVLISFRSAPWLAEYSLCRAPFRMYASSCHEANYSLGNILRGQRVADERAARKK